MIDYLRVPCPRLYVFSLGRVAASRPKALAMAVPRPRKTIAKLRLTLPPVNRETCLRERRHGTQPVIKSVDSRFGGNDVT